MNGEQFWAVVAFALLCGWTACLVLVARSLLPMANSIGTLNKVDALIDDRIMRTVQRIQERMRPKVEVPPIPSSQQPQNAAEAALKDLFGGAPLEPMDEQPDAEGLEVVGT